MWCESLQAGRITWPLARVTVLPMSSPVGIIPEELLRREKREEMIQYLRRLPIPVRRRKQLARGWAMELGVALTAQEIQSLEFGVELPG